MHSPELSEVYVLPSGHMVLAGLNVVGVIASCYATYYTLQDIHLQLAWPD